MLSFDAIRPMLKLKRLQDDPEAGVAFVSLPLPEHFPYIYPENLPASVTPVGRWSGKDKPRPAPRRLLIAADVDTAPETVSMSETPADRAYPVPDISLELFEKSQDLGMMWERHAVKIS